MIEAIDHVAIVVQDIEATAQDYETRLGLPLVHDEVVDELRVRLAYLQAGDDLLQLVQPLDDGPVADWLAENGEGLHHVCFLVSDMSAALDHLTTDDDRPHVVTGGRSMQTCFLPYLPSGLRVELAQP